MDTHQRHLLKEAGLKITDIRIAILSIFPKDGCKPVRAEDIFKKISSITNLVTVYRTLASFENKGIIKRVDLRKDSTYYELASNHHHHIVCRDCGKTESFDICDMSRVTKNILQKSSIFETVDYHTLELFGLCKPCSKR